MLKYTIASTKKIKEELSLLGFLLKITVSLVMLAYLTVATVLELGYLYVNIALTAITAIDLAVYMITRSSYNKKVKKAGRAAGHVYTASKIVLNAITLASIIYTVCFDSEEVTKLVLVLTPVMIIFWILQFVCELITLYVESRMELFVTGIQMDIETVMRPYQKVKNIVLGAMGEEPSEPEDNVSSHNRRILETRAGEDAQKRAAKRRDRFNRIKNIIFGKTDINSDK